ncbi:MAG: hypothetical protein K2Y21_12705 [Phycisphaerales bacterium]|nr:hypothetical protein [Phycisphaerales bacterium]
MLRRFAAALFLVQFVILSATAQVWTWTGGGATTNWLDPQNWSPPSVPPSGADVNLIFGLPKLDVPVVVRRLKMSAGFLDGAGNLTVTERMDWTSGVLQGTGSLIIAPGASLFGSPTFNGIPLTLSRRLVIGGFAAPQAQHLLMSNGSVEISSGGVLELAGDVGTAPALGRETGFSGQVTNNGTIRKITTAKVTINAPLDCGTGSRVEFLDGTLHLRQSGSFACKLNVPLAGSLIIEGSRTYLPGFEISGPGPIEIRSGTHDFPVQGIKDLGPFTISGGAGLLLSDPWETDAPFTVLESSSFGTNATATFRELVCIGTLRGTGTMRVKEKLTLDTAFVRNPLKVVLDPGATGEMQASVIGGTLRVEGGLKILPSGNTLQDSVGLGTIPGRLEVAAGATVNLVTAPENNATIGIEKGTVENRGTIRKLGDSKQATISSDLDNLGLVEITSGTLRLSGSFTNQGTLRVGADSAVTLASSLDLTWGADNVVEGAGAMNVETVKITTPGRFLHSGPLSITNSGRLTIANPPTLFSGPVRVSTSAEFGLGGPTAVADLVVNSAKLSVSGDVVFTRAEFTTAAWSGVGTGRFPPGSQVTVNQITGASSIVNESVNTKVSRLSATTIYNAPGATFAVVSPVEPFTAFTAQQLVNDGLITIPSSTSINGVLQNNGEIRLAAGVLLTNRAPSNYSAGTLRGGTWVATGGARFQFSDTADPVLTTLGPDTVVRLTGLNSDFGGTAGLRPLARNEGVLEITNRVKDLSPTGGTLVNAGDLRLHPGAVFSVLGNLTLDPAGSLTIDIGGNSASSSSGSLRVANTLSAAGRLVCGPVPPFTPSLSDVFQVATCGQLVGDFDELFGLNGYGPRPVYVPTKVFIRLGTCPPDFNSDGLVDDEDFAIFAAAYDVADCAAAAMPAGCPADFDSNELVDDRDFSLFASRYDRVLCY